jgi:hypothetical protein
MLSESARMLSPKISIAAVKAKRRRSEKHAARSPSVKAM